MEEDWLSHLCFFVSFRFSFYIRILLESKLIPHNVKRPEDYIFPAGVFTWAQFLVTIPEHVSKRQTLRFC